MLYSSAAYGTNFSEGRFDKLKAQQRSCAMTAVKLQDKLADLAPGETLLLSAIQVEQAFPYERTSEERRIAATMLAAWYRCTLVVCGSGESQILFTRRDDLEFMNFR